MEFLYDLKTGRYAGIAGVKVDAGKYGITPKRPHFESGHQTLFNRVTETWYLINDREYFEIMAFSLNVDHELKALESSICSSVNELRSYQDLEFTYLKSIVGGYLPAMDKRDRDMSIYIDDRFKALRYELEEIQSLQTLTNKRLIRLSDYFTLPWYKRLFTSLKL